ncbi:MAG: hypothetical protein HY074_19465 [Deltaproteobacteria bacterium]|nr:hypothetical protein [Deltaproteobacteria bacterium]
MITAATLVPATYGAVTAKKTPAAPSAKSAGGEQIINDAWYTMQAGSTPFGYFHEVIEMRNGRYSYRYAMTKVENNNVYEENIGALSQPDLTPIAFNLNKSGSGATESTNATYSAGNGSASFKIEVTGAKAASFSRGCPKNTILDVFFPVWIRDNWSKIKPGYRGWVNTFAEDPEHFDFRSRMVRFEVKGRDPQLDCVKLFVQMDTVKGDWCMTQAGVLEDLKVGGYHVKRASSEDEAKQFLNGILPKKKSGS